MAVARAITKCPAPAIANRVHDREANHILKPFDLADNQRAAGPRASQRNVQMVPSRDGGIPGPTVVRNPVAECVLLSFEFTFRRLLLRELSFHTHITIQSYAACK